MGVDLYKLTACIALNSELATPVPVKLGFTVKL